MSAPRKIKKIAIGGFVHETNSFAPTKASFDDFARADGWPALVMGEDLVPGVRDYKIPIAGFIAQAERDGHRLLPLLWCSAQPSGPVEKKAFDHIMGMLIFALRQAMPVDAVFLDLHGAMVSEQHLNADAEIVRRVRKVVGDTVPVVVSLDFHANVSADIVRHASAIVGYRTYPHVDMLETGDRAARLMTSLFDYPAGVYKSHRQAPFIVPVSSQCTLIEPARTLYETLAGMEDDNVISASLFMGFPPSDTPDTGPSAVAYATSQVAADKATEYLRQALVSKEAEFAFNLWQPDGAVRFAMLNTNDRPVIIADTQDNPGAGGSSDTTGLLEALIRHKAKGAVVACVCDPVVAALAHRMGEGKEISCAVGGKSEDAQASGVIREWKVEKLGNGDFIATGPMYGGNRMQLGLMALLSYEGVRVIVSTQKQQAATQAIFTHLGVDPAKEKILVLKSSVHFRADFADIAGDILIAESPGANVEDPQKLPYQHLRQGVRVKLRRKS